jgi:curved DNA-binding protein CbpA
MACKHSICGVCGGKKIHTKYIGVVLNDICSGKCQAATKDECSCKCEGKFHKGANKDLMEFLLEPSTYAPVQKTKSKSKKVIFQPITMYDYLAEFLNGVRIKTSSFDRHSDRNYRKDNKKLTLFWLSPKGQNIDTLANDFINETGFSNYDESDIINAIVNYINDYPSGLKQYIKDVEAERIRAEEFYGQGMYENNYNNEPVIFGAMKFKKGSKEAKAYMAKLRAKRATKSKIKPAPSRLDDLLLLDEIKGRAKKTPAKKVSGATPLIYITYLNKAKGFKQDQKSFKTIEAAIKWGKANISNFSMDLIKYKIGNVKPIQTRHKDTKSHNVNIKVVSGLKKKSFTDKICGIMDTTVITDLDKLKKEYIKLANKYHPDKGGTTAQFQELEAEYRKYRDALIKGSSLNVEQKETEIQLDEALMQAVNAIASLDAINIELVGKWLWVSGNTYPIRTELKAAGFSFAPKKKMWYYAGVESSGRGKSTMEEIRNKYGSTKIQPKPAGKLTGIGTITTANKAKLKAALKKVAKLLDKRAI